MPELPEVETIKNQLALELQDTPTVERVSSVRKDLRFPMPSKSALRSLCGKKVKGLFRRAKFLLFEIDDILLLSHLGMTGSWRVANKLHLQKHDHFWLQVSGDQGVRYLIYEDARRFGFIDLLRNKNLAESKWFAHLGPEPWDSQAFTAEYLMQKGRRSQRPIKNFLMDQEVVVGVGNIYASEVLYKAKVKPQKRAARLTTSEWRTLAKVIPQVLRSAVKYGGTTLRDYKDLRGKSGGNQMRLQVYGREGKACHSCSSLIRRKVMSGRSTFWCSNCQQ